MRQEDKIRRAQMLYSKGRLHESEACWLEALTYGESAEIYYGLGLISHSRGRIPEATERFSQCLALDANHTNAIFYLGLIAQQADRRDDALRAYGKVIQLQPQHLGALHRISQLTGTPDNRTPDHPTSDASTLGPRESAFGLPRSEKDAKVLEEELTKQIVAQRNAEWRATPLPGKIFTIVFFVFLLGFFLAGAIMVIGEM